MFRFEDFEHPTYVICWRWTIPKVRVMWKIRTYFFVPKILGHICEKYDFILETLLDVWIDVSNILPSGKLT